MYHRYSFFLAYTIFINGFRRGKLRRLGYRGLMSMIQNGSRWCNSWAPLVKTYSRSQLRNILEDLSQVRFDIRHLTPANFGVFRSFCPCIFWLNVLGSMLAGSS